jgi:C1A family cysteine protease/putative hemolysin
MVFVAALLLTLPARQPVSGEGHPRDVTSILAVDGSASPGLESGGTDIQTEGDSGEPFSGEWGTPLLFRGADEAAGQRDLVTSEGTLWMHNPAAVYCSDLGYQFRIAEGPDGGQHGVCTMPDGSECDAWDFLEGGCGSSFSICARKGLEQVVLEDGKNPFSMRYTACVDAEKEMIRPVTELIELPEALSGSEFRLEGGTKGEEGDLGEASPTSLTGAADLPTSFNWRDQQGADWTTPVKDQGMCGSCWAFSSVGVAEATLNLATGDPNLDPDLSEEYLVTNCASDAGNCAGGYLGRAMSFIRDEGIPDEACLPYQDGDRYDGCSYGSSGCRADLCEYATDPECSDYRCSDRCVDWESRLKTIDDYTYMYQPSKDAMKQALITYGPLAVAMNASAGSFDQNGVFQCSESWRNHGVSIVGYDDAGEYWIVKNSWGSSWGPDNDGYFKVAYDNCGIQADAYYAEAQAAMEGLSVAVTNQAGQPAVDAYVQVYADTGQDADYAGYTDGSGSVTFTRAPADTYTVVVNSTTDHFLLREENVQAPAMLSLDTDDTVPVDVYAYGLDGSTPVEASLLFAPFFNAKPDVGQTTSGDGHLQVDVTPGVYSIMAASFNEPYFLVKPNVSIDGALEVAFDPVQMATGEVTPDLEEFSMVRFGSWGSHSAWSWEFLLDDDETMTFSPDTYNLDPDLIKEGTDATWYYTLGDGYAAYQVDAGTSEMIRAGGSFQVTTIPGGSFYAAGDDVTIDNGFSDSFGNPIIKVRQYASTTMAPSGETSMPPGVEDEARVGGSWSSTCPSLEVDDASGQDVVVETSCGMWEGAYQFTLGADAVDGTYTADLSLDTGPHQGVVERYGQFIVDWAFGDFDGDGAVGVFDVQAVSGRWRTSAVDPDPDADPNTPNYDPLYDVDKDGTITVMDVMQVVSHWGTGGS